MGSPAYPPTSAGLRRCCAPSSPACTGPPPSDSSPLHTRRSPDRGRKRTAPALPHTSWPDATPPKRRRRSACTPAHRQRNTARQAQSGAALFTVVPRIHGSWNVAGNRASMWGGQRVSSSRPPSTGPMVSKTTSRWLLRKPGRSWRGRRWNSKPDLRDISVHPRCFLDRHSVHASRGCAMTVAMEVEGPTAGCVAGGELPLQAAWCLDAVMGLSNRMPVLHSAADLKHSTTCWGPPPRPSPFSGPLPPTPTWTSGSCSKTRTMSASTPSSTFTGCSSCAQP